MTMPLYHFDNHVVDIYLDILPNLMGKNCVNESLVYCASVLEAEGHEIVVVIVIV